MRFNDEWSIENRALHLHWRHFFFLLFSVRPVQLSNWIKFMYNFYLPLSIQMMWVYWAHRSSNYRNLSKATSYNQVAIRSTKLANVQKFNVRYNDSGFWSTVLRQRSRNINRNTTNTNDDGDEEEIKKKLTEKRRKISTTTENEKWMNARIKLRCHV